MAYAMLAVAIACEIGATTSLKYSRGFTVPLPTVITLALYALSFFLFSRVLERIDLAAAYATWCAAGIVATTAISILVFGDRVTPMGFLGLALCIAGVVIVNLSTGAAG